MSSHEPIHSYSNVAAGSNRNFGFVFAAVFSIIAFWPFIRHGGDPRWWSAGVSLSFFIVALVRPSILQPLNHLWFQFGHLLQKIISPIIMGIMFYVALTPMALLLRLFGKDLLRLKNNKSDSHWIIRDPPGPKSGTLHRQF